MTETLREKEELSRIESENLRKCKEEISVLRRKVDQHNELMSEKDRTAQVSTPPLHLFPKLMHAYRCYMTRLIRFN